MSQFSYCQPAALRPSLRTDCSMWWNKLVRFNRISRSLKRAKRNKVRAVSKSLRLRRTAQMVKCWIVATCEVLFLRSLITRWSSVVMWTEVISHCVTLKATEFKNQRLKALVKPVKTLRGIKFEVISEDKKLCHLPEASAILALGLTRPLVNSVVSELTWILAL